MNAAEAAMRARIAAAGGAISFEEFMRVALYDPEHGYYSRRVQTVGRTGDFSTAATLHPALADAVANWLVNHRREVASSSGNWHVIELGGGSGDMAARLLATLGWWRRRKLRYHLVDVSDGLQRVQRERLAKWRTAVVWHATLRDALHAAGATALICSNEFVDAFPCARWELHAAGEWRQIDVTWPQGAAGPAEVVGRLIREDELALAGILHEGTMKKFAAGQRIEVFLSYRAWMGEQLSAWRRGRLLTIDYGDEMPALYHRRPAGTLRAYCRQMRFTGNEIYARIGQQDLTADVDFAALQRWGEEIRLRTRGFQTLADFLRRWLPARSCDSGPSDPRLATLLEADGAGGAFQVLEQSRL